MWGRPSSAPAFLIISSAAVTTLFLRARGMLYELLVLSGWPGSGCLPEGVHCVQRLTS